MLVASDSTIKTAADCNGKTAASRVSMISHLAIMQWVDKNGGGKDAAFVEIQGRRRGAGRAPHRPHGHQRAAGRQLGAGISRPR